jgi:hypothetical protein
VRFAWALLGGCFPAGEIVFTPPAGARTAAFIAESRSPRVAHVIDLDRTTTVAATLPEDGSLTALYYEEPRAILQLDDATFEEREEWSRPFPRPMSAMTFFLATGEWADAGGTAFELPPFDLARCADLDLCLRPEETECRSPCREVEAPTPPRAPDRPRPFAAPMIEPPRSECLVPRGSIPIATGPGLRAKLDELSGTGEAAVLVLSRGRYEPGIGLPIAGDVTIAGCGPDTVIVLPTFHAIRAEGRVTVARVRVEGGVHAFQAMAGRLTLRDVSIGPSKDPGSFGIYAQAELVLERVSIEGRSRGIHQAKGTAAADGLVIRDQEIAGLYIDGGTIHARNVSISDALTSGVALVQGRLVLERAAIERCGFAAIATIRGDLVLRDAAIREISGMGRADGFGLRVFGGTALVERVSIDGVASAGIEAFESSITVRDAVITDVERPAPDFAGRGIDVTIESEVPERSSTIERVAIRGVDGQGLRFVGTNDSARFRVTAADVTVEGASDLGIILDRGKLELSRAVVRGGEMGIQLARSEATLSDITVTGARIGIDIDRQLEASVAITRVAVERSARAGIESRGFLTFGDRAVIQDAAISEGGFGLLVHAGGELELTRFGLRSNEIGMGLGSDVSLGDGTVEANAQAAVVHERVSLRPLVTRVRYLRNGSGIGRTAIDFVPLR